MIQESYVSFEQARDLKELGFPQEEESVLEIMYYYDIDGKKHCVLDKIGHKPSFCDTPYLSLVQKWLREEKEMLISMNYSIVNKTWTYRIDRPCYNGIGRPSFDTYEQALSAGIDKCIELLKQ